ncbi:MAG: hypothetical protein ACRC78_04330 [Planktothrix sp.]
MKPRLRDLREKSLTEPAKIAKEELDLKPEDIESFGNPNRKKSWIQAIARGRASKQILSAIDREVKARPLPSFKLIQTYPDPKTQQWIQKY